MVFYDRFLHLCKTTGVTPTQVARDLGIRQSTVSMWKIQGTTPRYETVRKLSKYFDVHIDYLLEKIDYQPRNDENICVGKPAIETLPVGEALQLINKAGLDLSIDDFERGLQQKVFPFGICVLTDSGPVYYIFKKPLIKWINERSDGGYYCSTVSVEDGQ